MKQETIDKWIKALRETPEELHTERVLAKTEDGKCMMCALGVLAKVNGADLADLAELQCLSDEDAFYAFSEHVIEGRNFYLGKKHDTMSLHAAKRVVEWNDQVYLTFDQIADRIGQDKEWFLDSYSDTENQIAGETA